MHISCVFPYLFELVQDNGDTLLGLSVDPVNAFDMDPARDRSRSDGHLVYVCVGLGVVVFALVSVYFSHQSIRCRECTTRLASRTGVCV